MSLAPTDEVVANIRNKVLLRGQPVLYGAQLGALVKREVPGVDFKAHGGLREFCQKYLNRFITWNGKKGTNGSDDLYAVVSDTENALTPDADWAPVAGPPNEHAWLTFASTAPHRRLAFSTSSGELVVSKQGFEGAVPDAFVEVASVNEKELRQVVEAFLPQVPASEKPLFEDALAIPTNYYAKWLAALRASSDNKLPSKWTNHRISSLLSVFKSRLMELGANDARADELLQELRDSQEVANSVRKRASSLVSNSANRPMQMASALPISVDARPEDESLLRLVVQDAVQAMAVDQLRELKLPVGLVLDAIYRWRKA